MRFYQIVLIVSFLGFCWLTMQIVHECGHVLGALLADAKIDKVALHPCIISRTDVSSNSHPLLVVCAGPLWAVLLPTLAFVIATIFRFPGVYLFRFFAGFCLIANGVYIGFGPSESAADSAIMMEYGLLRWQLVLFGLLTTALGLYLWHRQGPYFGLGVAKGKVNKSAAIVSLSLFLTIVLLELIINSR